MAETNNLEETVYKLFWSYNSPKDLSLISDYEKLGLAGYSIKRLYGKHFPKARQILRDIGAPSLPFLFAALGNDSFNKAYDVIKYIATKGNEAKDVAKQAVGNLHSNITIRDKSMKLIMETGEYSPRYLVHALGDDSVKKYAEGMLRRLHKDERYTDIVKQQLERAQDPTHTYTNLSRERVQVLLGTI